MITIQQDTAMFLLKDAIRGYQDMRGIFPKIRTYFMYLIFMLKARDNNWKSTDNLFIVHSEVLLGNSYRDDSVSYCKVIYSYIKGQPLSYFMFPIDSYWSDIIRKNSLSPDKGLLPVCLKEADNKERLVDIKKILDRGYGNSYD